MTAGFAMWWFNQAAGWTWFEVVLRRPVPDPFYGDIVLFLHAVPFMAAISIRPQKTDDSEGMLPSALNVVILLVWWVVVYAFAVFPDEYLVSVPSYSLRWDVLYLLEALIVIAVSGWSFLTSSGAWRVLYRNILLASIVYAMASEAINAAIAHGTYVSGGLYDVPFVISLLLFLRVAIVGRRCLRETQSTFSTTRAHEPFAPLLAKIALLSLPLMGFWALFLGTDSPYLRQVRFSIAMSGFAVLAFFVFLKQHLLDRKLVQLLRQSRNSYDNLERLQGRVVQQAKLASLGELVAMAASELEYPLSSILGTSERLASSHDLSREQLSTAQKIGQQDTHVARPGGVDAGQCADGIEAVEQEVRVDLRLQRLQFRVSRENAAFQRTSLRGARLFYLQDHVVRSHGQRIKHETRREQQRRLRRKFLIESLKCVHLR